MQQGPCLVEVAFIPITQVLDFMVGEGGKDGGRCHFLCKKHIIHLDNDLQQLRIDNASKFSSYYIFVPRFAYILCMFKCDVHHLMN
jgi:hypothetical protein